MLPYINDFITDPNSRIGVAVGTLIGIVASPSLYAYPILFTSKTVKELVYTGYYDFILNSTKLESIQQNVLAPLNGPKKYPDKMAFLYGVRLLLPFSTVRLGSTG